MMKSMLQNVDDQGFKYKVLIFICPGCKELGGIGLHMLPVNSFSEQAKVGDKRPMWEWDGNLEKPDLRPSILTKGGPKNNPYVCHSYLREGVFQYFGNCTHSLVNQHVPMVDLPEWVIAEGKESEE